VDDDELYRSLLAEFADDGVVGGSLFGWKAFKLDGVSLGCLRNGVAAFKLGGDNPALKAALEVPGGQHFDPGGKDRPFKDWVSVPIRDRDVIVDLLESAVEAYRS
jgi:hypothetical protein